MISFNELPYKRIDYDTQSEIINNLIESFKNSNNVEEAETLFKEIIKLQNEIEEMAEYADVRNMRDGSDEFYKNEMEYWNKYKPQFDILFRLFYESILNSKYIEHLKTLAPINFFNSIEYQMRISNDDIVELQIRENELKQKYREIIRSKVEYKGEVISLVGFAKYFEDENREVRKDAHNAYNNYFYEHLDDLDDIYSELVSIRNKIAKICGFNDYSEYSLYKLRRFGYDYSDIKKFRDNALEYFYPIIQKLNEIKKENLGVEELKYYDSIFFKEPIKLKYHGEELLNRIKEVFKSIDPDLSKFFNEFLDKGYIDLLTNPNKVNFGITNYLSLSGVPTVTGNYKNTVYDVTVSFHETGHAYQKHNASMEDKLHVISSLLKYPTFEIAEMFSHAMQLIGLDKIDILFDDDNYQKYCYFILKDFVSLIPYICMVDEFQEIVYKNNLSHDDIRKTWIQLSRLYHLEVSNSGHINLDSAGYFYRQSHIIIDPFYYIDYALSYFGAFAIYSRCSDNLEVFTSFSRVASYYPLKELLEMFDIPNPFDKRNVESISLLLKDKLNIK